MGQKVHPYGLRLGIIRPWLSNWFAEDQKYTEQLLEDLELRRLIKGRLQNAAISKIFIVRTANTIVGRSPTYKRLPGARPLSTGDRF